ncbi:RanBP2-type zinc finger protein-like protein, partial [Tanacetum coccineum]
IDNRNSSAVKRARTDGGRREDDWTCPSCGNVNFSFRTTCNMRNCTQPRPADHNSKSAPRQMPTPQGYSSSSPYAGSGAPSSMYMGVTPYAAASPFNGTSMPPYDGGPMIGTGALYGLPQLMEQFGLRLPNAQVAMMERAKMTGDAQNVKMSISPSGQSVAKPAKSSMSTRTCLRRSRVVQQLLSMGLKVSHVVRRLHLPVAAVIELLYFVICVVIL